MAKVKDKKLYRRLRSSGVRKKVARELTELPGEARNGRAPKRLRDTVERLDAGVTELRGHLRRGDRKTAAKKAARTRRAKAKKRSTASRKGARKRSKA